jgi:hypothetical protein
MTWEFLKLIIGELEEVILKAFAVISVCLVIFEILKRKFSEIRDGRKDKPKSPKRK